jgi:hypothetical protein
MYFQKVISKRNLTKNIIFVGVFKVTDERAGTGSVSQRHGFADPDGSGTLLLSFLECRLSSMLYFFDPTEVPPHKKG